jgi:hypothetical protein
MLNRVINLFNLSKNVQTTFESNTHLGAFDLVSSYTNTDGNDGLQKVVCRNLCSDDGQHSERTVTVKSKLFELQRVDNSFYKNITLSFNSENNHQHTIFPYDEKHNSDSRRKQSKMIYDFFKSKGVTDQRSLDVMSLSASETVDDVLEKHAKIIVKSRI